MYTEYWVEETDAQERVVKVTQCGTLAGAQEMVRTLESWGRHAVAHESNYGRGIACPDCGAGVGVACAPSCVVVAVQS